MASYYGHRGGKGKRAERNTWTPDVDAAIVRMRADDIPFSKIALDYGLKVNDTKNRWNRELKNKQGIIMPAGKRGRKSSITWTPDVDAAIVE